MVLIPSPACGGGLGWGSFLKLLGSVNPGHNSRVEVFRTVSYKFAALIMLSLAAVGGYAQFFNTPVERLGSEWMNMVALAIIILGVLFLCFLVHKMTYVQPDDEVVYRDVRVQLFNKPGTTLKKLNAGAIIVATKADGWIGKTTGKMVRDEGGDVIQDMLRELGDLDPCEARSVFGGRFKAKEIIAVNIFDDNGLTSPAVAAKAYDHAIYEAGKHQADGVILADFSSDFEYSGDRDDKGFAARVIMDAVARNAGLLTVAMIFVPDKDEMPAYKLALDGLRQEGKTEIAAGAVA